MNRRKIDDARFNEFIQRRSDAADAEDVDSRQGERELPDELRGLNWGALMMNFVWGLAMRVPWTWLHLVPFVGWVMPLVFWVRGNEWAWRFRQWESIEHFRRVQRKWEIAGVIFVVLNLIVAILLAASLERYMSQVMGSLNRY